MGNAYAVFAYLHGDGHFVSIEKRWKGGRVETLTIHHDDAIELSSQLNKMFLLETLGRISDPQVE